MNRLINFIRIFSICGAFNYGSYGPSNSPQVTVDTYYFDHNNNMYCPQGGVPVCATDYVQEYFFSNECRFNEANFKRLMAQQIELVKTINSPYNCRAYNSYVGNPFGVRSIPISCPYGSSPVCAASLWEIRTFSNPCEVEQLNRHSQQNYWRVVGYGPCQYAPQVAPCAYNYPIEVLNTAMTTSTKLPARPPYFYPQAPTTTTESATTTVTTTETPLITTLGPVPAYTTAASTTTVEYTTTTEAPTTTAPLSTTTETSSSTAESTTTTKEITTTEQPTTSTEATSTTETTETTENIKTTAETTTWTDESSTDASSTETEIITTTESPTITTEVITTTAESTTWTDESSTDASSTETEIITTTESPTITTEVITTTAETTTWTDESSTAASSAETEIITTTESPTITTEVITTTAETTTWTEAPSTTASSTTTETTTETATTTEAPTTELITTTAAPTTTTESSYTVASSTPVTTSTLAPAYPSKNYMTYSYPCGNPNIYYGPVNYAPVDMSGSNQPSFTHINYNIPPFYYLPQFRASDNFPPLFGPFSTGPVARTM